MQFKVQKQEEMGRDVRLQRLEQVLVGQACSPFFLERVMSAKCFVDPEPSVSSVALLEKALGETFRFDASVPAFSRTIALTGDSCSGRTTLCGKLAYFLSQSFNFKIAAIELTDRASRKHSNNKYSLHTYSKMLHLPYIEIDADDKDLKARFEKAENKFDGYDLVLVDTPHLPTSELGWNSPWIRLLQSDQIENILVVSAEHASNSPADQGAQAIERLGISRLALTSLDRIGLMGTSLAYLSSLNRPLSFLSSGASVRGGFEPAHQGSLAHSLNRFIH